MKKGDPSAAHLEWLVESRSRNQRAALKLFKLFESHPTAVKNTHLHPASRNLVAVCFSLWRAAFLADQTGTRAAVFEDAQLFLKMMLADNAINYPQDRSTREWTFNYYMNNANSGLLLLSRRWKDVESTLSKDKKVTKGTTPSQRRWDRHQEAFEVAVASFGNDLVETEKRFKITN